MTQNNNDDVITSIIPLFDINSPVHIMPNLFNTKCDTFELLQEYFRDILKPGDIEILDALLHSRPISSIKRLSFLINYFDIKSVYIEPTYYILLHQQNIEKCRLIISVLPDIVDICDVIIAIETSNLELLQLLSNHVPKNQLTSSLYMYAKTFTVIKYMHINLKIPLPVEYHYIQLSDIESVHIIIYLLTNGCRICDENINDIGLLFISSLSDTLRSDMDFEKYMYYLVLKDMFTSYDLTPFEP